MNIATGLVAPETASVDNVWEIGLTILKKLVGADLITVRISKTDLAVPLRSVTAVTSISSTAHATATANGIDPQLLFQRILSLVTAEHPGITLESCLKYELCPSAQSLFDPSGHLRVAEDKAKLAAYLILDERKEMGVMVGEEDVVVALDGCRGYEIAWMRGRKRE